MKVAILSLRVRFGDVTGDCVQAEKTVAALREIGVDAQRFYLEPETGNIFDARNELLGKWEDTMMEMEVIHTIPPIPFAFLKRLPKVNAILATSTVFWNSWTWWKVVLRYSAKVNKNMIFAFIREICANVGVKLNNDKNGYELLIANSEDEIRCVKKYCRLKRGSMLAAVPNAIDPIPQWVSELTRNEYGLKDDYVLVPAFFAPRKNQMTLINALKNFPYPVIFMGKGPMLEKCKEIATSNMFFVGHIEHGTRKFYSLMKFARVVCLPSNCETPGIAGLEAAALGARPVVPYEGGTCQYYGWDAEYLNPISEVSILKSVENAWNRGRLPEVDSERFARLSWHQCAVVTKMLYDRSLKSQGGDKIKIAFVLRVAALVLQEAA